VLTGRRDRFHTLRTYGGISGSCVREESECDAFNAGHASTSISAPSAWRSVATSRVTTSGSSR